MSVSQFDALLVILEPHIKKRRPPISVNSVCKDLYTMLCAVRRSGWTWQSPFWILAFACTVARNCQNTSQNACYGCEKTEIYLVGAPFALITASIRRGMEVISLWHCWGGMEAWVALIAGLQVICIVGSGVSSSSWQSMGFRSGEFAGQSSTVTPWSLNQLLVPLAVWAGAKSCWKMKSASP